MHPTNPPSPVSFRSFVRSAKTPSPPDHPLIPFQTRLLQLGVLVCLAVWAALSEAKLLGVRNCIHRDPLLDTKESLEK